MSLTEAPTNSTGSALQHPYIEIPFLMIVIVFGTLGNLMIMVAVHVDRKLRVTGISYVVNLAVVDLFITAWYLPIILANIFAGYRNVLEDYPTFCNFNAFASAWSCQASMLSLTAIALNRYLKVRHPKVHSKFFNRNWRVFQVLLVIWIQAFLVSIPIATGWLGSKPLVGFDQMMMACMWNDISSKSYNIFLVCTAIFIPLLITIICYYKLFTYVKDCKINRSLPQVRKEKSDVIPVTSSVPHHLEVIPKIRTHHSRQNSLERHVTRTRQLVEERERDLMNSVLVVLICFVCFWTPYALMTLINTSHPFAKRACGWLALSNSAINSFIYGSININFRQAYIRLLRQICCCICQSASNIFPISKTSFKSRNEELTPVQYTVTFNRPY